jgi:hypothetical protein
MIAIAAAAAAAIAQSGGDTGKIKYQQYNSATNKFYFYLHYSNTC